MASVQKLFQLSRLSTCSCGLALEVSGRLTTRTRAAAAVQAQQVRWRRRTSKPPIWWSDRKSSIYDQDLTWENKNFLKELVEDKFSPSSPLGQQASPLKEGPWERGEWTVKPVTYRTGVLALKIGVIPQWTKEGDKFFCTILQVLDNHVIKYVSPEELATRQHGVKETWKGRFGMVVVGALSADPRRYKPSYLGLFEEAGVPPKRKLTRFPVTPNAAIQPGTPLYTTHFRVGDYVDVQAKTIGHGFQGVVKRWGMKGMPASHGVTKSHRKMGSSGGGREKSGVRKGKRMPGHMGNDWRHLRGLKIWRINTKHNLLYVHGPCVPGSTHGYVRVFDSVLPAHKMGRTVEDHPPLPTRMAEDGVIEEEEIFADDIHQFGDPSIEFSPTK